MVGCLKYMEANEFRKELEAGNLYHKGLCQGGVKDKYIDILDVLEWDYYNDGVNPDTLKYKNLFFNITLLLADNNTNIIDKPVFKGDIGKARVIFLMYLTMKDNYKFVIRTEQKVIQYLLKDGLVYMRDTRKSLVWELNNVIRNTILNAKY